MHLAFQRTFPDVCVNAFAVCFSFSHSLLQSVRFFMFSRGPNRRFLSRNDHSCIMAEISPSRAMTPDQSSSDSSLRSAFDTPSPQTAAKCSEIMQETEQTVQNETQEKVTKSDSTFGCGFGDRFHLGTDTSWRRDDPKRHLHIDKHTKKFYTNRSQAYGSHRNSLCMSFVT